MMEKDIKVGRMTLGFFGTNCYFVYREGRTDEDGFTHCIFFDPPDKGGEIYEYLLDKKFKVDLILLTHGHFDHIGGAKELKELAGAPIGCYTREQALCKDIYLNLSNDYGFNFKITPDTLYEDGAVIEAAGLSCKLIATRGHTSGSCC